MAREKLDAPALEPWPAKIAYKYGDWQHADCGFKFVVGVEVFDQADMMKRLTRHAMYGEDLERQYATPTPEQIKAVQHKLTLWIRERAKASRQPEPESAA